MKKPIAPALALFMGLALAACGSGPPEAVTEPADLSRLAEGGPLITREEPYADIDQGKLSALPGAGDMGIDVRGADLSVLDLSGESQLAPAVTFDTNTTWPEANKRPAGFGPETALELGKNPGLGLRALHEAGITGQGVAIAIIDQALPADHAEYARRVMLYEKLHSYNTGASMHGPAVASLAAGESCGAAPGDLLYFIDCSNWRIEDGQTATDLTFFAEAIDRVIEINEALPAGEKIRVLSISRFFSSGDGVGGGAMVEATERAKAAGIFVVSCERQENYGYRLGGLGRSWNADPEVLASYRGARTEEQTLLVPQDARSYASCTGENAYEFSAQSGPSWTAPWLAGLYAICCQVDPYITGEQFIELAFETGVFAGGNAVIIDPAKLIEAIKS